MPAYLEPWDVSSIEGSSMSCSYQGPYKDRVRFRFHATFRQEHDVRGTYDAKRVDEWEVAFYVVMPPELSFLPTEEERNHDTVRFQFNQAERLASERCWRAKPPAQPLYELVYQWMKRDNFHPKDLAGQHFEYREVIPEFYHYDKQPVTNTTR